jgi:hypothetical protein
MMHSPACRSHEWLALPTPNPGIVWARIACPEDNFPEYRAKTGELCIRFLNRVRYAVFTPNEAKYGQENVR